MPGLSESLLASKSFTLIAAALVFLAAAVLLSVLFRFIFGRRVRLARNERARLPRLGTVDTFDLDRQRQLVIIRRDNVEHLLMIGGPNDLVIESQIIRAEGRDLRDFREARSRDKDLREKEPRDAPPLPAGVAWPSPAETTSPNPPQRKMPLPAATVLEPNGGLTAGMLAGEAMPAFTPSTVLPTPRPPAFPFPPRRVSPPFGPSGQRMPNQGEAPDANNDPAQRFQSITAPAKESRRASVTTPFLRSPAFRKTEGTAVRLAPSSTAETPATVPNEANSLPGFEEISASPDVAAAAGTGPATAIPTLVPSDPSVVASGVIRDVAVAARVGVDTLEAEMAKLLGRGPG
jgi:flagellar protein FliO/FliZ